MYVNVEVIKIIDDTNPYTALLWINWVIDNEAIINFKKGILTFEYSELRVVAPTDPLKGQRYVEQVNSEGQGGYMEHIYSITYARDDYVNPKADGKLSWRSISSCASDSGEALEIGRIGCIKYP